MADSIFTIKLPSSKYLVISHNHNVQVCTSGITYTIFQLLVALEVKSVSVRLYAGSNPASATII